MQPLIEIIRIENKLRPSFVQSFALSTFPPRGRLDVRQNFMQARGSLDVRKGYKKEISRNFQIIVKTYTNFRRILFFVK